MHAVLTRPATSYRIILRLTFAPLCLALLTTAAPAQYAVGDPFFDLNAAFRSAYADARTDLLQSLGPVVVARGDYLVLYYDGQRIEGKKVGDAYHQLKTVAHTPLGIFVMLAGHLDAPLSDQKVKQLTSYQDLIERLLQHVDTSGLSEAQCARQREQLSHCAAFIDKVLADGRCADRDLTSFCRSSRGAFMRNTLQAAQVRVQGYHRQMSDWKAKIAPDDWVNLQVVVTGAQMPRQGNLAVQYFARLLREPGEGKRIIYAESMFDEQKALNLLGTHRLDASAATIFFGDPLRLHRDLLADATPAVLDTLDWAEFRDAGAGH
jgi:hypothetical protein